MATRPDRTYRWRAGLVLVAVVILAASCTNGGSSTEPTVLSETLPGTSQPTAPETSTTDPAVASATSVPSTPGPASSTTMAEFQPPPPAPGIFAAYLGATGGPGCDPEYWVVAPPQLPHVGLWEGDSAAEVGQRVFLCFIGFDPNRPIDVVLTLPDGSRRSTVFGTKPGFDEEPGVDPFAGPVSEDALLCGSADTPSHPDDVCEFSWLIRPIYQPGRYAIDVSQGDLVAVGSFDLIDSTTPFVESSSPSLPHSGQDEIVARGDPLFFVLSGFVPDQLIPVAFYFDTGEAVDGQLRFDLYNDAGIVRADERGLAILDVDSSLFTPGVFYCLATPLMVFPNCFAGAGFQVS